jgi:hypothetical protein
VVGGTPAAVARRGCGAGFERRLESGVPSPARAAPSSSSAVCSTLTKITGPALPRSCRSHRRAQTARRHRCGRRPNSRSQPRCRQRNNTTRLVARLTHPPDCAVHRVGNRRNVTYRASTHRRALTYGLVLSADQVACRVVTATWRAEGVGVLRSRRLRAPDPDRRQRAIDRSIVKRGAIATGGGVAIGTVVG